MSIGENIKRRRLELKMSQDELARAIGYTSRSTINKIEADGRKLPQDKIKAIAVALRTTLSYILDWTDEGDNRVQGTSTPGELTLVATYRALNAAGKERLLERAGELSELPKYMDISATGTAGADPRTLSA